MIKQAAKISKKALSLSLATALFLVSPVSLAQGQLTSNDGWIAADSESDKEFFLKWYGGGLVAVISSGYLLNLGLETRAQIRRARSHQEQLMNDLEKFKHINEQIQTNRESIKIIEGVQTVDGSPADVSHFRQRIAALEAERQALVDSSIAREARRSGRSSVESLERERISANIHEKVTQYLELRSQGMSRNVRQAYFRRLTSGPALVVALGASLVTFYFPREVLQEISSGGNGEYTQATQKVILETYQILSTTLHQAQAR